MRTRFVLASLLVLTSPAVAQQPVPRAGEELVDRVVAVVGDTVLLLSDVRLELEARRAGGLVVPTDPEGLSRAVSEVVDQRVEDLILLETARAEGIEVTDADVADAVEQDIQELRKRFGSEAGLVAALQQSGRSLEEHRQTLTRQYVDRMTTQRFIQQRVGKLPPQVVTDAEVRAYFESQREQLGQRPANVSFEQVIIQPTASDSARATARRTAEDVLAKIRAGEDFGVLARRFSADVTSGERGGELGWFRQGQMVRPFENAAYSMRPGELSGLVETEFGFHIIRLDKIRGAERQARHILIRPEVNEGDVARARVRADSVAAAARAGAAVPDLAERYATPANQRVNRRIPLDRLPPAYAAAFGAASAPSVVGPFELEGGANGKAYVVARVTERQEAGSVSLEDVKEQIRRRLQEEKQLAQLLSQLRRDAHVIVRL